MQLNSLTGSIHTQATRASQGFVPGAPSGPVDQLGGSVPQPPVMMQPPQAANQPRTLPSGVQILKDQGGVAFQAVLPAGPLLPVRMAVMSGLDGSVQAQAEVGSQALPLQAQRGTDGKVYVQVDPANPNLVVFDPQSEQYGVSGPFQSDGQQVTRQHAQMIAPDGTKISLFNEASTAQGKTYVRVMENAQGQVWGSKVTETPAPPPGQGGLLEQASAMVGLGGRKPVQEDPLTVSRNPQGGYDVKGGSILGYGKTSVSNGFDGMFDWRNAPVQRWLRGRNQEELHLMPFSAAGGAALFPSLLQGVRP